MKAIQKGDKALARDLLTRLIKTEPQNSEYWLWLSTVVDTTKERTYCLQEVIRRDPNNLTARQGLILMGVSVPSDQVEGNIPSPKRNWRTLWMDRLAPQKTPLTKRLILPISGGVLALALIIFGVVSLINNQQGTAMMAAATLRPSATYINQGPMVPTGEISQPTSTPLWLNMDATYTPTPRYVATPHPRAESYLAGERALERGEWDKAIDYFRQVISVEPDAADVYYQIGEIYRQQGKFTEALKELNQAIKINPYFAPAYLSRARTNFERDPKSNIEDDLRNATALDRNYGEAYIELAAYYVHNKNAVAALDLLNTAESLLPDSPLIPLYRAEAYLEMDQAELALTNAEKAYSMDVVNLFIYRAMGFALQDLGRYNESQSYLEIYTVYDPTDAEALYRLGLVYAMNEDFTGAVDLFDKSLEIDKLMGDAYFARANARLEIKDGKGALSDYNSYLVFKPNSFAAMLGVGRSYLLLGDTGEAYRRIESSSKYAKSDEEYAQLYYYRATVLDLLGFPDAAMKDWNALLKLPVSAIPTDWIEYAEKRIEANLPPASATLATMTPTVNP
ncbi:MAG: tetratricopeptide repeat protein [Anaerolineaceae bacterium]|nr:tetratricopeptide repeat protein [Anaerolineaceae bacterium]